MPEALPAEEVRLALALARGDRTAMEAYTACVQRPLFAYALRMVRLREEAEDVAQEALVRLYEQAVAGKLRPDARAVRAMLFTIVHNCSMDALRRNGRDRLAPTPPPVPPASGESVLRSEIERALADLPAQQRECLLLSAYGGLSYADIAAALAVSEGVVKISIYRARRRLATLLDRDGQYTGAGAPAAGSKP